MGFPLVENCVNHQGKIWPTINAIRVIVTLMGNTIIIPCNRMSQLAVDIDKRFERTLVNVNKNILNCIGLPMPFE